MARDLVLVEYINTAPDQTEKKITNKPLSTVHLSAQNDPVKSKILHV